MENQYGYDEDLTRLQEDNPFWDCTDAAHPAWWRGHDYITEGYNRELSKILEIPERDWYFISKEIRRLKEVEWMYKGLEV